MNFLNKKAHSYLDIYIKSTYRSLSVWSGKGLFNGRCFHNAVQHALDNNHKFIVACMFKTKHTRENGIHFINFCPKKNRYIDDSTGRFCQIQDYFFIKKIYKESFFDVESAFKEANLHLRRQLPFYLRIFSDVCKP